MLLGVIADDFTGASDIANTLAKAACRRRNISASRTRLPRLRSRLV
jgi:uncharacterized protein YgbK (DUF1537 family)